MELLFSCSTRYQEIITVYILLLDTLFVPFSRAWDSKFNTRRDIPYQHEPVHHSLFIEGGQNGWFFHTASMQNPWISTNFNACLWFDRLVTGFQTALHSSTADHRSSRINNGVNFLSLRKKTIHIKSIKKWNLSFFFPNGWSKDVSKKTKKRH